MFRCTICNMEIFQMSRISSKRKNLLQESENILINCRLTLDGSLIIPLQNLSPLLTIRIIRKEQKTLVLVNSSAFLNWTPKKDLLLYLAISPKFPKGRIIHQLLPIPDDGFIPF